MLPPSKYNPDLMRDPSIKHMGIINLGYTGYIDSTLQQLFMCRRFRRFILSTTEEASSDALNKKELELMKQIRLMFADLHRAIFVLPALTQAPLIKDDALRVALPTIRSLIAHDHDPTAFVDAYAKLNETSLNQTNRPGDAFHFLQRLIDVQLANPSWSEEIKRIFYLETKFKQFCPRCEQVTTTVRSTIPTIDVTKGNLLDGISQFITKPLPQQRCLCGRLLPHAYNRSTSPPDIMIFRIDMIRWDQTLQRWYKTDVRFTFEESLNMSPFLSDSNQNSNDEANVDERLSSQMNRALRLSPKRCGDNLSSANYDESPPSDDYWYDFVGVVIVQGNSTQGAIFFSYIKDRETGRWLKFRGQTIEVVTLEKVLKDSFGGNGEGEEGLSTGEGRSLSKNAYIVWFERRRK